MKRLLVGFIAPLFLVACNRDEPVQVETSSVTTAEPPPPTAIPVTPAEEYGVAEEEPTTEIEVAPVVEPPAPTPGERLDHGIQKTEEGLRKAAEATGSGLRRLGETIERKAEEQSR